jgi:predicted SnoaL-like aldol condensation-catalyzing enzyme
MNKILPILLLSLTPIHSTLADGPLPVVPAKNQQTLLKSTDAKLAANKQLAYDFFRVILAARHLDQVSKFMRQDYIQHNPNIDTGMAGFLAAFSKLGPPTAIPSEVAGLVSIQAEGDFVTLSFVNALTDANKENYTTTWFDMFRIQEGLIAEHWDCDVKPAS